jgi:type IV secretory pathway VirB4 component
MRPLLRKDIFQKKIETALNTKEKTIVSIIQNDWLKRKTKFMMLILIPSVLPKEIVIVEAIFFWQKNEYRIEESGKK